MKTMTLVLTALMMAACNEVQTHELGGVAGAGVAKQELGACYAAKSKLKASYGCSSGWVEDQYEMRNMSGTCRNGEKLLAWTPDNQPTNGDVLFEVDLQFCRNGNCGWRLKHYRRCNCANDPCRTTDSNGN